MLEACDVIISKIYIDKLLFRLNEGFATLYENYLASLVYTEDRLMDTFVVDTVQSVLDVDASPSIRPMTYYTESPESLSGLFDRVAYDKCKSMIRFIALLPQITDCNHNQTLPLHLITKI